MIRNLQPHEIAALAGAGSATLLAAALFFQSIGYAPCELCLLQRWPHVAALLIGMLIWATGFRTALGLLGLLAVTATAVLGLYHMGVEYRWWQGPTECSGGVADIARLSTRDLMAQLQAAPVVRCDEVSWRFLGLSMAAWNMLCSAGLALIWISALRRARMTRV